jgi:MgtE intracellular N domain
MSEEQSSLLFLTQLIKSPVYGPKGEHIARLSDLIARLGDGVYPSITGLKVAVSGRELFVPMDRVQDIEPGRVTLSTQTVNLGQFERRPGEVLLDGDVLGRRLIDVSAGRLVQAEDIALARVDGSLRLVGVGLSRRAQPTGLLAGVFGRKRAPDPAVLDWKNVQPFVSHVPSSGLLMSLPSLKRLHPAQIADLVENSSHSEGEEIIEAVDSDPELSADVFEELDPSHQEEYLEEWTDAETAELLGRMAPDDAVDLLNTLDQNRRLNILSLMPPDERQELENLLQYNPSTAGGMMSPDYLTVRAGTILTYALEHVREDKDTPAALTGMVFVTDVDGRFIGAATVVDLLRGDGRVPIESLDTLTTAHVEAHADLVDVALMMTDFNLLAIGVTNGSDQLIGAISFDDLLEMLIPADWRRRERGG